MTSWVITIDKAHPQHWDIAKRVGFWDTTKFFPIGLGDGVYFWQAGGSMIARCHATSSAFPITPEHPTPWQDSSKRIYRARFDFAVLSEHPLSAPSWGQLQAGMVKVAPLQAPRSFEDPADEATLAALFDVRTLTNASYDDGRRAEELERLGYDLRSYDLRAIARRQGQQKFRNILIKAYRGACAVTGATTIDVLEAAHIAPFKGSHTHRVDNGLLLRSDIHTLFDLQRLTVLPSLEMRLHPQIRGGEYSTLEGQRLAVVPDDPKAKPAATVLREHNARCRWLDGG